jgi:light-regulated signal transduction histidine kinase (bacteriophytochrome)
MKTICNREDNTIMEKTKNCSAIVGEDANKIIQQLISALCGSSELN